MRLALVLCLLASVASVNAVVYRDDVPLSGYQDLATQSQFAPVGSLFSVFGANQAGAGATATLISNQWVLASAHTVLNSLYATTSIAFTIGGSTYSADLATLQVHPDFAISGAFFDNYWKDLAVFRLTTVYPNLPKLEHALEFEP